MEKRTSLGFLLRGDELTVISVTHFYEDGKFILPRIFMKTVTVPGNLLDKVINRLTCNCLARSYWQGGWTHWMMKEE